MNRKWWTLGVVSVATFMLLLDITVVNTALPAIQRDLGGSFTDLQWVIDAYALSLAALVLTAGSLADRLGRRRVFAVGLAIFSAASLCAGWLRIRHSSTSRAPSRGSAGRSCSPSPSRWSRRSSRPAVSAAWPWASTARRSDRRRRRPAGRRPADRRAGLGVGLPGQRPDRHRRGRDHLLEGRRVA